MGVFLTKANPSSADCILKVTTDVFRIRGRLIKIKVVITAKKDMEFKRYTLAIPRYAMVNPASVGPITIADCHMIVFRETAFMKYLLGTSRGIIDCLAGVSKAEAADEAAIIR